jgi:NitT/TauT family transport system substrate-binding protein
MKRVAGPIGLVVLLVLGTAPAARAGELVFNLDWLILGRHAGFFMALEKGYYKEAGLDIKIVRGYGSTDSINKITSGQSTFALGDMGSMVIARSKGAQVKMVAMMFGKNPFTVYSLTESNITKPKDLEGKSIAAPAGDSQRNMFPVFARLTGIDVNKVRWVTVDGAQRDAMVMARKADAATGFAPQIPVVTKLARAQNLTVHFIKWADHGFDLYSNALLGSDEFIRSNPKAVRGFVQATIRGHQAAFEAPDEAIAMMLRLQPTLDREVARAELDIIKDHVITEETKRVGIGWFNEKTLQTSVDWVAEVFKVEKPPLASLYTNEFLKRD